jgi:hypothetical protein
MSEGHRWTKYLPYVVMILLAMVEPATHLWILHAAPPDAVPTGVHTGDSSHHLVCMESFASGFASPFATCQAEAGKSDFGYFAIPIFLLYGLLGEFGRMSGLPPFLFLGFANGVGGLLLLWCIYRFMRRIAPREATLAFYLFAVGGGLGGMAFLASWATGALHEPGFELWFYRFAQYELIEGQHLAPVLLMPRLYYTLPLALGFAALTALVETDWCRCPGHLFFTCFLLFITACLNLRLGPLFWAVGGLYLAAGSKNDVTFRVKLAATTLAPVIAGSTLFLMLLRQHPSYQANVTDVTRECILLLPFLFATLFHWPALLKWLYRAWGGFPRPVRLLVLPLGAYFLAYAILYMGHQAWFGNWWRGGDAGAAVLASDGAFILGLPVAVALLRLRRYIPTSASHAQTHLNWVALWFLGLLVVSILAAGGGWFLQFSPQRGMILLGAPLALLAAAGLRQMDVRWARLWTGLILVGGLASNVVAAVYFQGPLGRTPGKGPFAYLHYEYMTEADARLLETLPAGTIAVPPWSPIAFGEIVVHHGNYQILGGPGAMNLGDQRLAPLQKAVNHFFDSTATQEERRAFVDTWCVDYVYCPDTCPVDELVLKQFTATPWLTKIDTAGRGAIFRASHPVP